MYAQQTLKIIGLGKTLMQSKTVGNLMNRSMFLTVNLNFGFFPCPTRGIRSILTLKTQVHFI